MFQSDRNAQQVVRRASARMLHRSPMLDKTLYTSQARGTCKNPHFSSNCHCGGSATLDLQRKHPTEKLHLLSGNRVARMTFQAGIVHRRNLRMLPQKPRHLEGLLRLSTDSPGYGAYAPLNQPAIK